MIDVARLDTSPHSVVVGLPNASDGIGRALRTIYRTDPSLSSSWSEVIARIDTADSMARYRARHG